MTTKKTSGSRGQMFIIAAVFMLVGMVMLYNLLGTPLINEEKKFQETRVLSKNSNNIMNEFKQIAGTATLVDDINAHASSYLGQFSGYIRNDFDSKILYVFIFSNGTSQDYYITVGNYIGEDINFTINVTNSTTSGNVTYIRDKTDSLSKFTSGINGPVTVNITYSYGENNFDEIKFNSTARNTVTGFFDVTLGEKDFVLRKKDVFSRIW